MSHTKISRSTGELILRKYLYLPSKDWYVLRELSKAEGLSDSELLCKLIRAYEGLPKKDIDNEREKVY